MTKEQEYNLNMIRQLAADLDDESGSGLLSWACFEIVTLQRRLAEYNAEILNLKSKLSESESKVSTFRNVVNSMRND